MKLLFLAPFGRCDKQTTQRRFLPLARAMASRGHHVELLIPPWDCPRERAGIQEDGGVTIRTLAPGAGLKGFYPRLHMMLLQAIHRASPQVLIGSKGLGYAGWAMDAWRRRGGCVVLDVDDLEDGCGWGARRNWLLQRMLSRQEQALLHAAAGVMTASRFLKAAARRRSPRQRLLYLPNGLTRTISPAGVGKNPPVALLLTRGHDVSPQRLARIWRSLLIHVPRTRLSIVGDWPDAPSLPRTQYLGWLEDAHYRAVIRNAALALFLPEDTSLLRAKSPARLLDCAAQGLPVVTLDVGEYGILVRDVGGAAVRNEDELATQCASLLTAPDFRARVGGHIWQRAAAHAWSVRAAALDAWLHNLIAG